MILFYLHRFGRDSCEWGLTISNKDFGWLMNNPSRLPYNFGSIIKHGNPVRKAHQADTDGAKRLLSQNDDLHQKVNDFLDPIMYEAMAEGPDACQALIDELPSCSQKSEMVALIIQPQNKK